VHALPRHPAPAPPGCRFPHPDFYWAVHAAECDRRRGAVPHDDYQQEPAFEHVASALTRIDLPSRIYVRAALLER
jgi:hypothetical protein